jgi:hypothetical protein
MTQNSMVRKGNWEIGKECDLSAKVHTSTGESLTVVRDAPRTRNYAAEAAKQRCFSSSVDAQDCQYLSGFDCERDTVQRAHSAVPL